MANEHPSILVVDDELLIRDLLYDYFNGQGWDITVAENGEKALELLGSKDFDILLTDLKMPQMDGMALTAEVRQKHPGLPVVIMTGFPTIDSAIDALRNKVEDYIVKPFNINQLYKTLKGKVEETKQAEGSRRDVRR